jgi:hypothetical protein
VSREAKFSAVMLAAVDWLLKHRGPVVEEVEDIVIGRQIHFLTCVQCCNIMWLELSP